MASCVCPTNCDHEAVSPVCSVYGREYDNLCLLHKEGCSKKKNIRLAYKGHCIASQRRCEPEERKQFPFRLMDWFVHLKQNDDFGTVDPAKTLTTITDDERMNVAVWKFQTMDKNKDQKLSQRELRRFRYALMPMEHCAADFFKFCDNNKDGTIHATEWSKCLVDDGMKWFLHRERMAAEERSNRLL